MPIYDYQCEKCKKEEERFSSIEYRNHQFCSCGGKLKISFKGSLYDRGYERRRFPYYDESLDCWIESSQKKREILKERGLVQHDGLFSRGGGSKREKKGVIYSIGSIGAK